jgi:galactitol-specific phosphotransferase system IIC component
MTYQETNVTVSLVSYILIAFYYVINWLRMYQAEGLNSQRIFTLWVVVIVAGIVLVVAGSILTAIVRAIIYAIKTQSDKTEPMVEDERDKLIGLKGSRIAYIAYSVGIFIAMLSFALGQPPLIMFSLIVLFSLLAEILENSMQLVYYRRGV